LSRHEISKTSAEVENGTYVPIETTNESLELVHGSSPRSSQLILSLWRERRFIVKALAIGIVVSTLIALVIPKRYEASTRLLPPDGKGLGALAAIMAGGADDKVNPVIGGLLSEALGMKTSGALYVGVLGSRTVQDKLIDRFDLRKIYSVNYQKDARERLAEYTEINEDRKSGIITISVTDKSPERARDLASAYVRTMNDLMAQVNTSAAHRERVFIEDRLKTVKQDLDTASKQMSEFSSTTLTLDVKEQGKAMLQGAATLQGELIATESQLSGLEQIYTSSNFRVRSLRARVDELKRQIASLEGTNALGGAGDPNASSGNFPVSIARLPQLGVTYFDLYRTLKIQETVFEILTKQLELAKIQEAKELPTVKVLDEAAIPETKASPKRALIVLIGASLSLIFAAVYVVTVPRLRALSTDHPLKQLALEMRAGFSDDVSSARNRFFEFRTQARSKLKRTPFKPDDNGSSGNNDVEP
jgi:uncharacterized protein involved in exopolysaccharide biosynthesis